MIMILAMSVTPSFSADDDSTPYMPYPEQPQTQPVKKAAPKKKTPVKKPAPKKKTPARKPAQKKTTAKKSPVKPSSLQQAITLINQGRYKEAKQYLLSAINADRNNANVWYWYGVWHKKLGCFHEAQYFYTKALKINPSLEPLSRVVYYPDDPDKIPLWDPKRPARVYPIETGNKNFTTVPPFARDSTNFPDAPDDPVIPKVPVYVPPEPGSNPLEGDSWSPAVYVPPSPPNDMYVPEVTVPVEAEHRETVEFDMTQRVSTHEEELSPSERDRIIRVDLPLYTPPAPGQKVTPPPATEPKVTEQPKKKNIQPKTPQPEVPRRIVRQTKTPAAKTSQPKTQPRVQTRTKTQRRTTPAGTSRTESPDVRPTQPKTQRQPARQPQRQQETPQVQPEVRQPETQRQPERQAPRQELMPPVGQYPPDPGTISETPIPPVGQGNNY